MNEIDYYSTPRTDLMAFIPPNAKTILDVGCGTGATGAAIKQERGENVRVCGIEYEENIGLQAKKHMDDVFIGDVQTLILPFQEESLDCILYGDVLEHLVDPWGVVRQHKKILKPDGVMIASIPNIAHYRTIKRLKNLDWTYEDSGLMDRTHLRFFTINTMRKMFEDAGLNVEQIDRKLGGSKNKKFLNKILGGRLTDSLTEQYILVIKK